MRIPVIAVFLAALSAGSFAAAQTPSKPVSTSAAAAPAAEVVVAPIECWWKVDRNAVRVGETFSLTLTCALLDTERARVTVDESSLAPSALHLVPFEIVDGQRFRDVLNAPRRFFQYQYAMRLLGEEFFGKEITLPRLQISYRVQNSLQGGQALQGREAQYSLTPIPVRVLSLVPATATDIRDTPLETFGDVEARLFRSNILLILAGVAFALAVLVVIMLAARAAIKRRATVIARQSVVSPLAALGAASRELGAVRKSSLHEGWSSDLAGRAAAALRLAGAVAVSQPISQHQIERSTALSEGQLATVNLAALRGKKTAVSAAVTPGTAGLSEQLGQALGVFTAARYSRNGSLDDTALEAALSEGQQAVKGLRLRQWLSFGRQKRPSATEAARQAWER